jgi:long-chain acyl-CoA synthetase
MNIFDDLKQFNAKIALIDENDHCYTYRDLDRLITAFGEAVLNERKSLILVSCKNTVESLIGYLGGIAANQGVLMVDSRVEPELLEQIMSAYQPDYIWKPAGETEPCTYRFGSYGLTPAKFKPVPPIAPELSLVMLTSGSTGSPKGVRLTTENINANAQSIAAYLGLSDTERPVTSLPMSYVYGLSVINSHLYVGATILLTTDSIIKKTFWDFFQKHSGTSFAGVPYTFEMLKTLRFFTMDLPGLRYFTQAGGRLRAELVTEYAEYSRKQNLKFYVMYGQTEATARISYLPPESNLTKNASIGRAIPGGRLFLLDEAGKRIVNPGQEGSLYYEGPNVMLGYAEDREDLGKGDELKGLLNTHDIACFDADGFFYITGRDSRFIKIAGQRINLDEIENYFRREGWNCITGGEDELLLMAVAGGGDLKKIKEVVVKKFRIDFDNVEIFQVPEIAKNINGKPKYAEIFSEYQRMRG